MVPLLALQNSYSIKIAEIALSHLFGHLQREHSAQLIDWFIELEKIEHATLLLSLLLPYKSGVLVGEVSKVTEFILLNETSADIINVATDFLCSSIPLNYNTRLGDLEHGCPQSSKKFFRVVFLENFPVIFP